MSLKEVMIDLLISSILHIITYLDTTCICFFFGFSRSEIGKTLFSANEVFQRAILEVRFLCEKACSSITGVGEGDHAIALLHVDPPVSFTLREFCDAQEKQSCESGEKLKKLRSKVLGIVKDACEVCLF